MMPGNPKGEELAELPFREETVFPCPGSETPPPLTLKWGPPDGDMVLWHLLHHVSRVSPLAGMASQTFTTARAPQVKGECSPKESSSLSDITSQVPDSSPCDC